MKRFLIALIIFSFPLLSHGQEIWTLEKCIHYAWENNLQIKQQNISVEQSENQLLKSKLDFIPSVSGSFGHSLNWGRSVDLKNLEIIENKLSQSSNASVGASILLLDGLSKLNTLKSNKVSLNISLQEVEKLKNEISISITKAYLQVLLSKEILTSTESNFASITEQRDRTKLLVDAGSQPYSSLLDMESQLASERLQLVTAKSNVVTNTLTLMQLLDLEYSETFQVSVPENILNMTVSSFNQPTAEGLYAEAVKLPVIKSAELSLEKSKYDLKLAKGKFYPTISMSASYGTYFSSTSTMADGSSYSFFSQFKDNINPSVGFSLNVPIFNNYSVATNSKNAKLTVENQEIALRIKHQTLFKEVQQAIIDAESYYQKMEAAKINLTAIEESFRYVENKFNLGVLQGTDYTVSKTNLFKAQSDYYQAKYQFIFQLKIIDFYKGIPITL